MQHLTITTTSKVIIPEGATHYFHSSVDDKTTFFKMQNIGIVGEHWFIYIGGEWMFHSHIQYDYIVAIPDDLTICIGDD